MLYIIDDKGRLVKYGKPFIKEGHHCSAGWWRGKNITHEWIEATPPKPQRPEPTQEQLAAKRAIEVRACLAGVDEASVRPLRAIAAGLDEAFDRTKLAALDAEARGLRAELAALLPLLPPAVV